MTNEQGKIWYGLGLDNSQLRVDAEKAKAIFKGIGSSVESEGSRIDNAYNKISKLATGAFMGVSAASFVKELISVRSEFQNTEASFKVFLGSAEKAKDFMSKMQGYAFHNVFEFKDLTAQAAQLLAFRNNAEDVIPILDKLSNIAAGANAPLSNLVDLYNKAKTKGELNAQDIQSWGSNGVAVLHEMADMLGKSVTEIDASKIKFADIDNLLTHMTSSGGRYAGMMEEKMKTLGDSVGLLKDSIAKMFNEIGEGSQDVLRGGILTANFLVEHYEQVGKVIMGLVATYGAYRAAVVINTVVESGWTVAQAAHLKMLIMVERAHKMLKATMLTNPYVLATVALVGLAAAMWAFHDSSTAAERAQKRVNEETQKFADKEKERRQRIDELIRTIQDETETKYAQIQAYEELKRLSPAIAQAYSQEEIAAMKLTGAQKELNKVANEERDRNQYKEWISNADRLSESLKKLKAEHGAIVTVDDGMYSTSSVVDNSKSIEQTQKELALYEEKIKQYKERLKAARPVEVRLGEAKADLDQIEKAYQDAEQKFKEEQAKFQNNPKHAIPFHIQFNFDVSRNKFLKQQDLVSALQKEANPSQDVIKLKDVVSQIKTTQKELSTLNGKSEWTKTERERIGTLTEGLSDLKKQYKSLTGNDFDKEKPKDTSKEEAQLARDRAREVKDAEFAVTQSTIDAKQEGIEKVIAQNNLNYDREVEQLKRQREDMLLKIQEDERRIWEAKGLTPPTQTKELPQNIIDGFNAEEKSAATKRDNANKDVLDNLVKQYQTYADRRKDIEEKFNEDIVALTKKNTNGQYDSAIEEAKKKQAKAIKEVNDEEAAEVQKTSDLMVRLYSDASQKSVGEIRRIVNEVEELVTYLEKTEDKDITPKFGFTAEQLKSLKGSTEQMKAMRDGVKSLNGEVEKRSPFQKFANDIEKALAKIKEGGKENIGVGIEQIGASVQAITPVVKKFGEDLGTIFGDSQLGEDIGILTDMLSGLGQGAQGVGQIMSGDVIGGITNVVSGIASIFAMANGAAERHSQALKAIKDSEIAQQREYNLLLLQQNLLYEQGNTIFGTDQYGKAANAIRVYKEALGALSKEIAGTDDQKSSAGKAKGILGLMGFEDANAEYKKKYAGLADIEVKTGHQKTGLFGWGKGRDVYSSILDVYPELITKSGDFNKEVAQTAINTREMSNEDKAALQNMINLAEQYEEAMQAVKDYLSGIFGDLGNTMSDALVDAFKNGTDAAQAFADSVAGMLENLAKQMIYSVTLGPLMETAQKQMLETMQNDKLDANQKFAQYASILGGLTNDALAQQDKANQLYAQFQTSAANSGIDIFQSDATREASKKGFAAASQDSVEELNGRFTLLTELTRGIKQDTGMLTTHSAVMLNHLAGIESNTARLEKIEGSMDAVRSGIDNLNTKGVLLRT